MMGLTIYRLGDENSRIKMMHYLHIYGRPKDLALHIHLIANFAKIETMSAFAIFQVDYFALREIGHYFSAFGNNG